MAPNSPTEDPNEDDDIADVTGDDLVEIIHNGTVWRFDRAFLTSNWTCIWGRGCQGILDEPAAELNQGCCSVGAELVDDEPQLLSALVAMLDPEHFEYATHAAAGGVYSDTSRTNTRVVDGACIFLNRPGFAGGEGCALHLAAIASDEPPSDWKPSVCWQLPIKVDWTPLGADEEIANVRGWQRKDWGESGETMAWLCTEAQEAYVGRQRVIDSLAVELTEIAGAEVYVELKRRIT
jgi:hypothetical protein